MALRAAVPSRIQRQHLVRQEERAEIHTRLLLALDGHRLDQTLLKMAFSPCRDLCRRVDILIARPTKPPTQMLARLLLSLELCGIDYRLTTTESDLLAEVLRYLRRFPNIGTILLESLHPADEEQATALRALRADGLRLIDLSTYRPG